MNVHVCINALGSQRESLQSLPVIDQLKVSTGHQVPTRLEGGLDQMSARYTTLRLVTTQ